MSNDQWMKDLKDVIGDTPIRDLVFPGTHDSATFNPACPAVRNWFQDQDSNILQQLQFGIRFLDIRLEQCCGNFFAHHFIARMKTTVDDIFHDINVFFDDRTHDRELLVLRINQVWTSPEHEKMLLKRITSRNGKINPLFAWRPQPRSEESATSQTINQLLKNGNQIVAVFDNKYYPDDEIEKEFPVWCNDNNDDTKRVVTMDQVWADTENVKDLEVKLAQYQNEQANKTSLFVLSAILNPQLISLWKSHGFSQAAMAHIKQCRLPPSVRELSEKNNSSLLEWIHDDAVNRRLNVIIMNFAGQSFSQWCGKDLVDIVTDINKKRKPQSFS